MREFTITIQDYNYYNDFSELSDYLYSLNGIEEVIITQTDFVTINTKYNEKLINDERIRYEILAFFKLLNYPSIYTFDKHQNKTLSFTVNYRVCCEMCYGNIVYTLIDNKGVIKVESDFYDQYWKRLGETYYIKVYYDPKLINKNDLKKLKEEIDVYG